MTSGADVPSQYAGIVDNATTKYGLPEGLLAAVAKAESSWDPRATSSAGAAGLMQLMPSTAKSYGVDPYNPSQAVDAAGKILSGYLSKYDDDMPKALAAYNYGPGALDKVIKRYGSSWQDHIPQETKSYIHKILGG